MKEKLQRHTIPARKRKSGPQPELKFICRDGTSDRKAIEECVDRNTYRRYFITVEPGETWLDLGVNVGGFSCLAAALGANVIGYEADPDNYACAKRNLSENGLTANLRNAAIVPDSHKDPTVTFYRNTQPMSYRRNSIYKGRKNAIKTSVPAVKWGTLPAGACVKMNIEGAEIAILKEITTLTAPKLVFEFSFDHSDCDFYHELTAKLNGIYEQVKSSRGNVPATGPYKYFPPNAFIYCKGLKQQVA